MRRSTRIFAVAFFSSAPIWSNALAYDNDSQRQNIAVKGVAPFVCKFLGAEASQAINARLNSGGQNAVSIGALADPLTAKVNAASISVTLKGLCNCAHMITVATTHGGLAQQNASLTTPEGFSSRVDYTTHIFWASSTQTLETSGLPGSSTPVLHVPGPFSGDLRLNIVVEGEGSRLPMLAGAYTDNLTIHIQPRY